MAAKSIIFLVLLFGLICFGMPENPGAQVGTGVVQDEKADGQRLVRELETALKSRDQERIRLAQQRVNAHQQAARILQQRPALQRQLQTATRLAPAQPLKSQIAATSTLQKETLTRQTDTLKGAGGLSSATKLQGAAGGMKEASSTVSAKVEGVSKQGIQSLGGRSEGLSSPSSSSGAGSLSQAGVSSTMGSGVRSGGIQGFSSSGQEGVAKETGTGVSSGVVKGMTTETARGLGSRELISAASGDKERGLGAAVAVGTGVAASASSGSTSPPAASAQPATPEPPAAVRRTAPPPAPSTAAPPPSGPPASGPPVTPGAAPQILSGVKPASALGQKLPTVEQSVPSSPSMEVPRSMAAPGIMGRGRDGTSAIEAMVKNVEQQLPPKPLVDPNPTPPAASSGTPTAAAKLTGVSGELPQTRYPALSSVDVRGRAHPNPLDPLYDKRDFLSQPEKQPRFLPNQNHPTLGNIDQLENKPPNTIYGSYHSDDGPLVYKAGQENPVRKAGTTTHEVQHQTTHYLAEKLKPGGYENLSALKDEQISSWQEAHNLVRDRGVSPNHPEVKDAIRYYEEHGGDPSKLKSSLDKYGTPTGHTALTEGRASFQEAGLMDKARTVVESGAEKIQKTDQALGRTLGLGELPKDASALRSGLNTTAGAALTGMAVVGSAAAGYSIGNQAGEGIQDYQKAGELRDRAQTERQAGREQTAQRLEMQAEKFENQGKEKLTDAGKDTAMFGGALAAGVLAPTATGLVGAGAVGVLSYQKTRDVLENTETGRKIDKATENFMDRGMQAGEALSDQMGGLMGRQTQDDKDRTELTGRQGAYDRALAGGTVKLQEGVTRQDLLDYVKYNNPASPDYQAGLNQLISRQAASPPTTGSPATSPTGGEAAGTTPGKSRQEQDLEDWQKLQAIKNLQGGGQKPDQTPEKDTTPPPGEVKDPPAPPDPVIPTEGGDQTGGTSPLVTGGVPGEGETASAGTTGNLPGVPGGPIPPGAEPNTDRVSQLMNVERSGTTAPLPGQRSSGGGPAENLQLALNTNVTGSLQQNLDLQWQQGTQQALGSMRGTQADRDVAAQNQQMQGQSQVQAQGQLTSQAIAGNAQEFINAQQTLQVTRQNSLGNILLGGFMGGLTSGIAIGLDNFFWGTGRGAGQQVSANWGISPLPPTHINTGTGTTSQTGGSTSPTTGTIGTTTPATVKPPAPSGSGCRSPGICPRPTDANRDNCCDRCGKSTGRTVASVPGKPPTTAPVKPPTTSRPQVGGPGSATATW